MKYFLFLIISIFMQNQLLAQVLTISTDKNYETIANAEFSITKGACTYLENKKLVKIKKFECDRLKRVYSLIHQVGTTTEVSEIPVDAEVYSINLESKTFKTLLQAPRECEIASDGNLYCKVVTLLLSQKIILELLSIKQLILDPNY